jgi:hypothetical protein
MKRSIGGVGYLLMMLSGGVTWLFMMFALVHWLGLLGFIASIFVSPGVVIFPFVYWLIEHQFPLSYFIWWGIGIVGLAIAALGN